MNTALQPNEILDITIDKAIKKTQISFSKLFLLAMMGGIYISLGYLAYLRVSASMTGDLAGLGGVIGAAMFPIGLISILIGGGELITGNMLVMGTAWFNRKITSKQLAYNWFVVTLGNLAGSLLAAWFLGHMTGLTEGMALEKVLAVAAAKTNDANIAAFFSAIGCNIFVCLAAWMSFAAKDVAGKVLAIWFPVFIFVAIGFQHIVANMFVIPAAIFSGESTVTWMQFLQNMGLVWLGNMVGGTIVIGFVYSAVYGAKEKRSKSSNYEKNPADIIPLS